MIRAYLGGSQLDIEFSTFAGGREKRPHQGFPMAQSVQCGSEREDVRR